MNIATQLPEAPHNDAFLVEETSQPLMTVAKSSSQHVLSDIYQDNISMAIWKRPLVDIGEYAQALTELAPNFTMAQQATPDHLAALLRRVLPDAEHKETFIEDVKLITEMFACLFDLEKVGVRLSVLSKAMCPRFHVDKIPCRLISTYYGKGSEWIHDEHVIRSALGRGGVPTDLNSGMAKDAVINTADLGDVILMKGDVWTASIGRGVVHRSPSASIDNKRLFLSLDLV